MDRFFLTTPIYYVNDVPHIGHAYTTIAADVLARWARLRGKEVFFLTGTDEHGTKIAQAAAAHNQAPQDYCDQVSAQFQAAWKELQITPDAFLRTTSPAHQRAVQQFLKILWDKGVIYRGRYQGKYCVACERFYTDEELIAGLCPDHRQPPEVQAEDNYFFRLSHFREDLLAMISDESHPQHFKIYPLERRNEVIGKLRQEINDVSISRATLAWGVPLPWDRSQTTYVWVDALLNYLSATGYPDEPERSARWWPADLHLMAKDILWFHAVIWPALLRAAGMPPPRRLFVHGFFTVNGQKMSKSLGNVVRPGELIGEYGVDGTRYLLLSAFPFGADGDFSRELMKTAYNAALANGLGNLVSRALTMVEKYCGGRIPGGQGRELTASALADLQAVPGHIEHLQFHLALAAIWNVIARANRFIEEKAPWKLAKTSPAETEAVLRDVLGGLQAVAVFLWPFMPDTAQQIWFQLGQADDLPACGRQFLQRPETLELPPGQAIRRGAGLFPRKSAE